jgi:hypothetical protein
MDISFMSNSQVKCPHDVQLDIEVRIRQLDGMSRMRRRID